MAAHRVAALAAERGLRRRIVDAARCEQRKPVPLPLALTLPLALALFLSLALALFLSPSLALALALTRWEAEQREAALLRVHSLRQSRGVLLLRAVSAAQEHLDDQACWWP